MGWLSRVGAHFIKRQNRLLWSAGPCRHSSRSVVEETQQKYSAGQKLHGYTVQKVVPVPELYLTGVLLHHDRTGAEHLHVARDDANNVFGVAFRTTPMDSTGVPHILEHTALCGSEKFPVRDPFFKMLNRSLSTFMNAFTSNDWTFYPFSTQNPQDYENLLSVYLDAAFFPRLREHDFRQEGWRLENENLSDPDSSIVFKGIVFNEMKGVFSNSQNIFAQKVQNTLMPSHTYSVVSGGDPMAIPDLTWQQLRDFHSSHYHPSNARFYTYGNLPLEHHLQFIDGNALSKFDKIDPKTEVPLETRWTAGRDHDIICSPDPMAPDPAKQTTVAVSYLLTDITDTKESTVLSILGSLLVDGDTSPFYQSLLEANIGSDYSPVIGYDANTREASFSVGLQGIHQDDIAKVKDIIHSTIDKVTEEGFEQERVDALLHRIELSLKHESEKFGLNLGVSILGPWNHGADPTELMQVSRHVNYFKQCLHDDPNFLKNKVRTHFKDNQHKVTLVMRPDENFEKERQEEETRKLHSLVHSLSDSKKKEIYLQGQKLADLQNAEEDLSCLPSLKINDIAPTLIPVHTDIIHAGKVEMQISEQPTNGVTYFCAVSNTRDLPAYLKAYVPLFCSVVTKMGAGEYGYKELSQQMELHTGGMNATCHIASHHTDHNAMEEGILFSSFSLDRNVPKMFELWTEVFHRLDLSDGNRLTTLVLMSAADLASSLADSGHRFAMTHAASSLTATAQHKEGMNGVSQVSLMKALAEMKDLSPIIHNLKEIASHVLSQQNLRCAINAAPEFMNSVVKITETFVKQLKDHGKGDLERYTKDFGFMAKTLQTQFELPFQVNYMSRSCRSVPFTHPDFADLRILARLMTNKYLHREIREKGGAYGGGATGQIPGVFNFYSYRDPNSMSTLEAFDAAVEWVKRGEFTQQDVDEAKLSTFSQVDMPLTPGHRGERLFLTGITDSMLQDHRMQLFAVNKDSLITASDRYLSKENRVSSVSFLGPENPAVKNESWSIKKH